MASQFRTVEELKKDMAQLDLLLETDVQVRPPALELLYVCDVVLRGLLL